MACGVVAAATLVVLGDQSETAQAQGSCRVRDRIETITGNTGHPKGFTEPGERAPESGFGHVIGDGYVIVQYRPQLPAADLDALRNYVRGGDGRSTCWCPTRLVAATRRCGGLREGTER